MKNRTSTLRPHSAFQKAFTIYELLFVVVIIGVLFATALPRFVAGDEQTALQTTANNIARLSAYARQSAISVNDTVTLTIHPEDRVWYIDIPRPDDDKRRSRKSRKWEDRKPRSDEEKTNTLHKRLDFHEVLIEGEENRDKEIVLNFFPNGTATTTSIILKAKKKENQMTIDIEGATGQVSAYNGEPKEFAEILEEAGLDPTKFAGVSASQKNADEEFRAGEGFSVYSGSSSERTGYYQDAAARIMGRKSREIERQRQEQDETRATLN